MKKLFLTLSIVAIMIGANAQKVNAQVKMDVNATYQIISATGTVMDVAGGKNVGLWDNGKGANQKVKFIATANGFYHIKDVHSNKVYDIARGDAKGRNIGVFNSNLADNQKFKIVDAGSGYYYIMTVKGYYLSSETIHMKKGSNIFTWTKNDYAKWRIIKL